MPSAWGDSWGSAWGNSWGAIGVSVVPSTATLLVVSFSPVLKTGVTPQTVALATSTFGPSVLTPVLATPPTRYLVITVYEPSAGMGFIPQDWYRYRPDREPPEAQAKPDEIFVHLMRPDQGISVGRPRVDEVPVYRGRPDQI